jgi:hypothetical protein
MSGTDIRILSALLGSIATGFATGNGLWALLVAGIVLAIMYGLVPLLVVYLLKDHDYFKLECGRLKIESDKKGRRSRAGSSPDPPQKDE